MDKKDPYILLVDNVLGRLSLKYNTAFKYEVKKIGFSYNITIFQDNDPIYSKDVIAVDDPSQPDFVHYEVLKDFLVGGIERIFMQRENAKKIFPKDHAKISDPAVNVTKGKW